MDNLTRLSELYREVLLKLEEIEERLTWLESDFEECLEKVAALKGDELEDEEELSDEDSTEEKDPTLSNDTETTEELSE